MFLERFGESCAAPILTPCLFSRQARRGVKRQADTTTPSTGQPSPNSVMPVLPPMQGVPHRRESTRQVKRPKLDLPGEMNLEQVRRWGFFEGIRLC